MGGSPVRHTARSSARIDQLADELAIGAAIRLRTDSDAIRPIVDAVVAYLVEEYPSQDLYIPATPAPPPELAHQINADIGRGMSMRALCRKYRRSRRTLYALLDGLESPLR